MSNAIKAFGSIERGVRQLLLERYEPLAELDDAVAAKMVGGDFGFKSTMPFYIRVDKLPARMDRHEGDFPVDIEVFASSYGAAESHALDLDALVLGYPHVVTVDGYFWHFDQVVQNAGPDELPWESDKVTRMGATYVLTARRR